MKRRLFVYVPMNKRDGGFTANLFSLQLQLKALLEDAGGDQVGELLDSLCKLTRSEQSIVLKVFSRVVGDILGSDNRLVTDGDVALKRFEDSLYEELVTEMKKAVLALPNSADSINAPKLEIVKPQSRVISEVINLADVRQARKGSDKPVIN